MKQYVIMKSVDNYELSCVEPIGVSNSKKKASEYVNNLKNKHDKICNFAIKDTYGYNSFNNYEETREYSKLCTDFIWYIRDTYFPYIENIDDLNDDHLTEYEYTKYLDLIQYYDSETFIKWCLDRGLSQETIDATIEYNKCFDFKNTTYYFEEVESID